LALLDFFRRRPPIRDAQALADFIDQNAAFLMQKGIYEYSRARAGHYSKVLFGEPGFQQAVEESRWRAYPLGLAIVCEMVEGVLRPHAGDQRQALLDSLAALTLSVFDRYPVPAALGPAAWADARVELERRIARIGLHAPKAVKDIPEVFAETYFDLMPIHEKLRGRDFPTTRNYLRVSLCNIHEKLTRRIDAPRVAASLCSTAADPQPAR
jgi:hypothetical protein